MMSYKGLVGSIFIQVVRDIVRVRKEREAFEVANEMGKAGEVSEDVEKFKAHTSRRGEV